MLKNLVILLIGALLGANVVYFVLTRDERMPAPAAPAAPRQDDTGAPVRPGDAADPSVPSRVPTVAVVPSQPSPAGLVVPVSGVTPQQLSDTFDDARGGERVHQALDIMARSGTPVVAVADGSIEKLFDSKQGGLTLYQFEPSGRYAYYYAHLERYAPGIVEKKTVRQGEVIGYVGFTGNADPAAPHLHFAVFELGPERQWWKGTPLNPYPLLGGHQATASR